MTEDVDVVIAEELERTYLPESLHMGVALLLQLVERGVWKALAQSLRVQREGGYVAIDGLLFLLLYFGSGARSGIKGFAAKAGLHGEVLAALGGRKSLPTQSAMSRLLNAMDEKEVRAIGPWMLWEASGAADVVGHPMMQTIDARGQGWHVVDYDPTKTVLRQRSLPAGEDLPPPRRRCEGFAAPGHSGHKRGEVQVSRATLQHAGSGLWLDARVNPGNGDGLASLASAIKVSAQLTATLSHPLDRVLMRLDGEFGNVPALTLLDQAGQPALTRLNRSGLLDQPDIWHRLATGTWHRVPDSGSGPVRSALDLGWVTVPPGRETRRADGSHYEPIKVRVVVSRYRRDGEAEHGRVIDGWQYELFAALRLTVEAWPAHEVVAAYFGRGGQENRFAQEDRELGLDRVFSYNLAGQELACLVGLMVWNLQIVHGFHLAPPPTQRAPAPRSSPFVDDRPVPERPQPVEASTELEVAEVLVQDEPVKAPIEALSEALAVLDWALLLHKRRDWVWDANGRTLRCPAGAPTTLTNVTLHAGGKSSKLLFRAPAGMCGTCPLRAKCFGSARSDAVKLATYSVPAETGERLAALLVPVHLARRLAHSTAILAQPPRSKRPRRPITGTPFAVELPTGASFPDALQIAHAPFLPAAARQAFGRATATLAIQVDVKKAVTKSLHPYLSNGPAQRQHRRATWTARLAWYALPQGSAVRAIVHAGATLAATFPWATPVGARRAQPAVKPPQGVACR